MITPAAGTRTRLRTAGARLLPRRATSARRRDTLAFGATFTLTAFIVLLFAAAASAAAPSLTPPIASEVQYTTTIAKGTLDPSDHQTSYRFQYVSDQDFAESGWTQPVGFGAGSLAEGAGATPVEGEATELHPGTTYHLRLLAENEEGEVEALAAATFTTKAVVEPSVEFAEPGAITEVTGTTATFTGRVDPAAPNPAGSESAAEEAAYRVSWQFECTPACPGAEGTLPAGDVGREVSAEAVGLTPARHYEVILIARDAGGARTASPLEFTTPTAPPTVTIPTALELNEEGATLRAEVDPGGAPTGFHIEYVSDARFQAHGWAEATSFPVPDAELPAVGEFTPVLEHVDGLLPATTYHFRFAATNPRGGPVAGAEATLQTAGAGLLRSGLPDHRVLELVSTEGSGEPYQPQSPTGGSAGFPTHLAFRAADDGEAVAYIGQPSNIGGTGEIGPGEGNQWLAIRGPAGWRTEDITPDNNSGAAYQSFSASLATGFYEGNTAPLSAAVEPGCRSLYTRSTAGGAFSPLFLGGWSGAGCGHPLYAGSSAQETTVIFQSEAALTPGTVAATEADVPPGHEGRHKARNATGEGCMFGCNLYAWEGGRLSAVNVIDGTPVPSANFGGFSPLAEEMTDFSNDISTDGSRIFWTNTESGEHLGQIYVRVDDRSVRISGGEPAEFWTATPDGRYAYYTEAEELHRFDLDRYDSAVAGGDPPAEARAAATEIIAGPGAAVRGVIGVNETGEDGSYLYFVAGGVLAENKRQYETADHEQLSEEATPQICEQGSGSASGGSPCNLYVRHAGVTSFIATLSPLDNELRSAGGQGAFTRSGAWSASLGRRIAQVTPDGRHLTFQSVLPLTGYDNGPPSEPLSEVFVYSAAEQRLFCASCEPTGAPPSVPEGSGMSRFIVSSDGDTYMHRSINADGSRVFFDTTQPLARQDRNGVQDVYEWERPTSSDEPGNTCTAQAASPVTGGCTYLLSGGRGSQPSFFVDADLTGENVFFEHVGPLGAVEAPIDHNELYDARVDGGFSLLETGCAGVGCSGGAAGQATDGRPASVSFEGRGNVSSGRRDARSRALARCRRLKTKKARRTCEQRVRRDAPRRHHHGRSQPKEKRNSLTRDRRIAR